MVRVVVVTVIGFVTGILLAFGGILILFDWAHQGPNTRPWQAVVGWLVPALVIAGMLVWLRGDADRRRKRTVFLLSAGIGIVAVVLLLVVVSAAEAGTIDRVERAKTLDTVEKLRARYEPRIRTGDDDYRLLRALADAYARFGREDTAVGLLERHEARFTPGQIYTLRQLRVDLLAAAGRLDDAIEVATAQLAEVESAKDVYHCHRRLGELYEQTGDWAQALEHHSAELPPLYCARCKDGLTRTRTLSILRCRFHLGQARPALDGLFAMMTARDAEGRTPTHTGRLFCEYAARSGRLDLAEDRIAKLGAESRAELGRLFTIATAFAEKAPAALVAAVEAPDDTRLRSEWTARLLFELGDAAIEHVETRVAAGSVAAYELARYSGSPRLLAALEARLEAEADPYARSRITWAVEHLRAGD